MRYLGRALGLDSSRYVLASTPDAPDWRALGIHPIGYKVVDGSHLALVEVIEGWASLASMRLLDHRQRVDQLVSAPPSQVPEEASYLETVLTDGDTVGLFAGFARGSKWLAWAATRPEFRRLFDPSAAPGACTWVLADWFAERFVMDKNLSASALNIVRDPGGRLAPPLWSTIGHEGRAPA
ncbi:MAG TPA: hypothetical protein VHT75_13365 [Acidimicrobiales bacterium]|nr:hypothetical protein [Acidimicrobiales bacterium]